MERLPTVYSLFFQLRFLISFLLEDAEKLIKRHEDRLSIVSHIVLSVILNYELLIVISWLLWSITVQEALHPNKCFNIQKPGLKYCDVIVNNKKKNSVM